MDEVAATNPDVFMFNGEVSTLRVLSYLGFDVRTKLYDNNVKIKKDALIRSSQFPRKCYKTKVYQGFLRMAAIPSTEGKVTFHKSKLHHMEEVYSEVGTLQARNVLDHISEDQLLDIATFGGSL